MTLGLLHPSPPPSGLLPAIRRGMAWLTTALSAFLIGLFIFSLGSRLQWLTSSVPAYQAWVEGAVYVLSLSVLLVAIFSKRLRFLPVAALLLCQGYLGAYLLRWQVLSPQLLFEFISPAYAQQLLIGSYLFLLIQTLFMLGLLSFTYLLPVQLLLYFGSALWLLLTLLLPGELFHQFLPYAIAFFLVGLNISIIAREWVHNLYLPLAHYVYSGPVLISTAVCGLLCFIGLQLHILPELLLPFGSFILIFLLSIGLFMGIVENLAFQKEHSLLQHRELGHYRKLSPFGLLHLEQDGEIIYYNNLFAQWVENYHLPHPIQHWNQYFAPVSWQEVFTNTHNNEPTHVNIQSLSIEMPEGVDSSFCIFGFAEKNAIVLYLVPANAYCALTMAAKINKKLTHRTYTLAGLEEVFLELTDSQRQSGATQPSFFTYLTIKPKHRTPLDHTQSQERYHFPIVEALHQYLDRHTRTPFYVAKISANEFGLILTRFTVEHLNTWLQAFLSYLQNEFIVRYLHGHQAVRWHAGLVELDTNLNFPDTLNVAKSACEEAAYHNQPAVIYQKDAPEIELQTAKIHFFEQLNQGSTRGLFLLMQPIINLANPTDTYHAEVLLRFRTDDDKLLPTQPLISSAEQNGAITTIDKWVFRTALKWFSQHIQELDHIRCLNLNLSGVSLNQADFITDLYAILQEHQRILPRICIEITESIALADLSYTRNLMARLKQMGVKIALDDFGAGYTSFTYLRELPASALKIDGSLIRDMLKTPSNTAIIRTIVELAQNLEMESVAEWVEDVETLIALKKMGVNYVQGFAISEAVSPALIIDNKEILPLIADAETARYLK